MFTNFILNSRVCILPLICSFEPALYPGLQSAVYSLHLYTEKTAHSISEHPIREAKSHAQSDFAATYPT